MNYREAKLIVEVYGIRNLCAESLIDTINEMENDPKLTDSEKQALRVIINEEPELYFGE